MAIANNEQMAKIETILAQLDHVKNGAPDENRRRAPRVNARLPLTAIILSAISPCPVQIHSRNLSVSGLGFVSRRMFKSDERIAIHLRVKELPPRLVLARVTFARYVSAGWYETGAEFLECMKDSEHLAIPPHWLLTGGRTAKAPAAKAPAVKVAAAIG